MAGSRFARVSIYSDAAEVGIIPKIVLFFVMTSSLLKTG
jgi:hypothetical protein